MNILIVHNKYQSKNIGGEDVVFTTEYEQLCNNLGEEHVYKYEVSNEGINKLLLLISIWYSFKHYFAIKKMIRKHRIDIVHVHNFFPSLTPSVFLAAKKAGAKVILTLHNYRLWCISGILYRDNIGVCEKCVKHKFPLFGVFHKCYRQSTLQSLVAQLALGFYRIIGFYNYIDYFFVLTEFQRKKVISLGLAPDKVILKPNGKASLMINEKQLRNGYIFIGRLEISKGIYEVLKCWKALDKSIDLTILGVGDHLEELMEEYIAFPNIKFMGKCSNQEALELISKSKFLIQSSLLFESFGLTIIEALMLGVPVIGFNIGTRPEFIKNEVNGFLCEKDGDLRDVILRSYSCNEIEYKKLSYNALLSFQDFEISHVIAKQVQIYNNILAHWERKCIWI